MPGPAKRQRPRLSGRRSSSHGALPPPRSLTASPIVARALLRIRILVEAAFVAPGLGTMAGPLGSTGAKRPCAY